METIIACLEHHSKIREEILEKTEKGIDDYRFLKERLERQNKIILGLLQAARLKIKTNMP